MESLTEEQRALFASGGQLDDYDVLKPIGKGKFSVVYKAKRKRDEQPIALKKISIFDMMDTKAREKTLKEVRLVQSVSHPNIIQYLDAFIANNELYIAFEWAEAGDLKRQIRKANEKRVRFDERTIWRYFAQLCAAILHMHNARIMHRDLKPANIFLTLQGVVKVGDLGLGRHLSENTMEAHSKVGTPLYMSPEVLRGEGYDWKSDVWSLGCILYELAMLRSPFKSEGLNLYGLFQKINKGDYEALPAIYSEHLRSLVTRMISLGASDRPTMEEVWSLCQMRPNSAALAEKKERLQAQAVVAAVNQLGQASEKIATAMTGVSVVRRKKMRAKDVPSPEDTLPPSSRPSSSQQRHLQQEDTSTNSSSRPPSSQRSTTNGGNDTPRHPDETKQKQLETRMEFLYERLKLLQYEKILRKHISCKYFLEDSRSLPQVNPQARFNDMCVLVKWLLQKIGVETVLDLDSARLPVTTVQIILLAAERAEVRETGQLSAPALTSGVGEEVCMLLDALCEKALEATRRSFQMPCYPKESVEEMDAQDHLEVGAEDDQDDSSSTPGKGGWGDSTASTPGYEDEDDLFAKWLIVKDEKPVNESDRTRDNQHTKMIHASVDPLAWRRELERMTPTLRNRMAEMLKTRPKESSWHARIDILQQNVGHILSNTPDTLEAIADAHKIRQKEGMRIETVEKRVNEQFRSTRRNYHECFTKLAQNQDQIEQRQRRVHACTLELTRLQTEGATAANEVKSQNDRLTDNSALFALKTQLKRVEQENEQFATQLEVLRYYLSQRQQLQQISARMRLGKR